MRITFSIFPKFLAHLTVPQLAAAVKARDSYIVGEPSRK